MKWVRDITKVSKRERMAAGIVSMFVAIGLSFLIDGSMGIPPIRTLVNNLIMLGLGLGVVQVYTHFWKRHTKGLQTPPERKS